MAGKKKKGSKKKKKSSSVGAGADDLIKENVQDPKTLMSGAAPVTKRTKSGKLITIKKKKLTKAEKEQEKLENNVNKMRKDPAVFHSFLDKADRWLQTKARHAIHVFDKIGDMGEGVVSYELFKSYMFDLNIPLNKVELHLLATLLDTEDCGEIDYTELLGGLSHIRDEFDISLEEEEIDAHKEEEEDTIFIPLPEKPKLILPDSFSSYKLCSGCKMSICEPYKEKNPKYLQIELRLITFNKLKKHPGHIKVLVHAHLHVFGLIQLITKLTYLQSQTVTLFREKTRSKSVRLKPESTLEECGYPGYMKDRPQEVLLYYDYTAEYTRCPILNCDFYFGQNVKCVRRMTVAPAKPSSLQR